MEKWKYIPSFLTSELDGAEWSALPTIALPTEKRAPDTHWLGSWVGPKAVIEGEKSLASARNQTPAVQPVIRRYTD
jgi:hypothetical protein